MNTPFGLGAEKNPVDIRNINIAQVQAPVTIPSNYTTDISMFPVFNQRQLGACVGHSHALIEIYNEFKETGKIKNLSPRYIYALAKKVDGLPGEGTYPRIAADIQNKKGCSTEDTVLNDTNLSHDQYINIQETDTVKSDAYPYRTKGYVSVNPDSDSLKQAVYQNGLVSVSITVGGFSNPIPPGTIGQHRITLYGYEDDRFLFRNSWGAEWGLNGNGYIEFASHAGRIFDAMVFTDIPDELLKPKDLITVKYGDRNDTVKILQTKLGLIADGIFGAKTKAAVIAFQQSHGLRGDGIVGKRTWTALEMVEVITKICVEQGVEPLLGVSVAVCESGLDPKSTLYNPPSKSTDRGLFQWNNVYHKEISDEMAFDPATATKLFCNAVKAGQLHNYWSASQACWSKKLTPEIKKKYNIV